MKIIKCLCAPGKTGFFYDDQQAVKRGAVADGGRYKGVPVTPGYKTIRQAGESISIMLLLEDGQIACGDCAAVMYSGMDGRDPLFIAENIIPLIEEYIFPGLTGKEITNFREMADEIENKKINGLYLHSAVRYGLSQAFLDAAAKSSKLLMCQVIADEYSQKIRTSPVDIFVQTGDDRYINADKAIIKRVNVLPHGLFNNVETKLGTKGEILLDYIKWLRNRIIELRENEVYDPTIHIDVYGSIGQLFGYSNFDAIIEYLNSLINAAKPFALRIEGPVDTGDRQKQIEVLSTLTKMVDKKGLAVELVADEWCNTLRDIKNFADNKAGHMLQIKTPDLGSIGNTVEAVLYCKEKGIKSYIGGTCNETERSAQICAHIAMATSPDQILAKPGMGVDEGYMIVFNEMSRIITLLR